MKIILYWRTKKLNCAKSRACGRSQSMWKSTTLSSPKQDIRSIFSLINTKKIHKRCLIRCLSLGLTWWLFRIPTSCRTFSIRPPFTLLSVRSDDFIGQRSDCVSPESLSSLIDSLHFFTNTSDHSRGWFVIGLYELYKRVVLWGILSWLHLY